MSIWTEFLDQWDGMWLGDMNIDHCNWTDQSVASSNQTHRLKDLISALFTRILTKVINRPPTTVYSVFNLTTISAKLET